jgi:hypothetical protein
MQLDVQINAITQAGERTRMACMTAFAFPLVAPWSEGGLGSYLLSGRCGDFLM